MDLFRVRPVLRSWALVTCSALVIAISTSGVSAVPRLQKPEASSTAQSAPRAVTKFTSFNFGDVYNGEVISQVFIIRNEGDADLQIKEFIAGCACAVTRCDKVIPPGKEGIAILEVQTISQQGGLYKTATMRTNDPERPSIDFALIANVLKGTPLRQGRHIGPVFLSPETRGAMYAMPGKTATFEFSVTADNAPVKLLKIEGGEKHFASRIEAIEPGKSYKLVVESLPQETGNLYVDQFRITTDNPNLPAFTVELTLRVYSTK